MPPEQSKSVDAVCARLKKALEDNNLMLQIKAVQAQRTAAAAVDGSCVLGAHLGQLPRCEGLGAAGEAIRKKIRNSVKEQTRSKKHRDQDWEKECYTRR
eukprot:2787574-Rhodomonas_salina.1